jgi:FKBP-type peptidyl-prolyl cis-trans isomerase FklB
VTNYSVGYQWGRDLLTLKGSGIPPNLEQIVKGLSDALAGAEPAVGTEELTRMLEALRQQPPPDEARPRVSNLEENALRAFTELNAKREGVVTLDNGLQYRILTAGSGKQPKGEDLVTIHYKAALPNGVVFDDTYADGEPVTVRLDQVAVPGLAQALALMSEGAKWEVFVPSALGFPEASAVRDRPVIYEIELLKVETVAKGAAKAEGTAGPGADLAETGAIAPQSGGGQP